MARAKEIPVNKFSKWMPRQTTRVSANVSGLLGTTRVALNDNLSSNARFEIRAVMAHEMGHYVPQPWRETVTHLGPYSRWLRAYSNSLRCRSEALGRKWRIRDIADPAGLPLLALISDALTHFCHSGS
jgi:STE24 endopeptidase